MSAEVISMEKWQRAKFEDWATRYVEAMLSRMTPRQIERLQREIHRMDQSSTDKSSK